MADDESSSTSAAATTLQHMSQQDNGTNGDGRESRQSPQGPGTPRVVVVGGDGRDEADLDDDDDNNSNGSGTGVAEQLWRHHGTSQQDDEMELGGSDEPSFNLRLIEAVRQSRCLYDAADRQYRSADYKIKVWNRLVEVLNFSGDARTLYNRWKQLRDKYGKEKKKMKYNGEPSQWQFFKHLEFLDPHMVDRTQQKFERTKDGKLIYKETIRPIVINDPSFGLHLVNEVRLQPCLFDIKDSKYRHTEFRNQAWAEIIKNLNFPGDINAIYKQWKKIRDRYVREKRKMRMSANGEHEEPTWDLFRELLWIDPYLEERAAQVKRKRESSELSDDIYLDDFNNHLGNNSTTANSNSTPRQQPPPQQPQTIQHQQQQYMMVMAPGGGSAGHLPAHLSNKLIHTSAQASTSIGPRQIRGNHATTTLLSNGATLMPIQGNSHVARGHQLVHHQAPQQQHVIITNEPLDGDRAFALSVSADLCALPDHARSMARAQIQHLLENSKITIVKA